VIDDDLSLDELRRRLEEAEETLRAIRCGEVDALIVDDPAGAERVYTLRGADTPYRVFVEQMHEGAVTLMPEGFILYCNHQFAALVGRPLEDVIGASLASLVVEDDREGLDALLGARRGRRQLHLASATGEPVPVYVSLSSLGDSPEDVLSVIVTDVRELRRAEVLRAEAEAASQAKDHFLAVLSHELRTPLTPVLTGIALLERDQTLSPRSREFVEVLRRNVELEARLIDDLLDLTRIARGKVNLDKRPIDLGTVIEHAIDVCRPDIEARRLHFGVDWGPRPYIVEADATRVQQVLWNLIKNAIKFTPHGGCVGLRCWCDGDDALVEVSDSGLGIEPSELAHIFDAFVQAERSTTRHFGGLGLGLAISKALVEMHGGRIHAHSDGPNTGARFTVRLPMSRDGLAAAGGMAAADRRAGAGPLRILLVEDHGDTAEMVAAVLELEGHRVHMAADVATALEAAAHETFDLLVSDLGLPDGSGLDVMRALRSRGQTVPGIALTGYAQETDVEQSRAAGFEAHMVKPVDPARLLEVFAEVARRPGAPS
jgi:PAS domain S-box-containing protein